MRRFLLFILIAIVSMLPGMLFAQTEPSATTQAVAAMSADDLPDAVLHGDLMAVVVLDLKSGDKTAWFNAASVITGGRATTRPLGPGDSLPMGMEQAMGPIFKMGAERLVYVVSLRNGNADLSFGFRLAEGTSEEAANAWLRKNLPANPKFEHDGAVADKAGQSTKRDPTARAPAQPICG